jgi:Cas7 group CRISPR-associated protein Csh2
MTNHGDESEKIMRGTGLLVIEVIDSNPNGDPDRESDPRQRPDSRGEISPVSFKRKIRDLIEWKGDVWQEISKQFNPELKEEEFAILESGSRGFSVKDAKEAWKKVLEIIDDKEEMKSRYWDARVFGSTFLEKGEDAPDDTRAKKDRKYIRTGVVQFGLGVSVAPVSIRRLTTTKKASAQESKDRGMAPLGFRIVEHGVYCMPFYVNPTAAQQSGCTKRDIDLLLKIIPYAYSHTRSYPRTGVEIRHAWYIEHKSVLGSCSDFALIAALTPTRNERYDPDKSSKSWGEYCDRKNLPNELEVKVTSIRDLMEKL